MSYRYGGSSGYGRYRRRSHRLRNGLIVLLTLLIGGAVLAATGPGAALLGRLGLRGGQDFPTVAQQENTPAATDPTRAGEEPSGAPSEEIAATEPSAPGAAGDPTTAPPPDVVARPNEPTTQPAEPTRAPPAPTPPPSAGPLEVAQAFLGNWKAGRYPEMYALVSDASKKQFDREYFLTRYTSIAEMATTVSVDPKLSPRAKQEAERDELMLRLPFDVTTKTRVVGDVKESNLLTMVKENNEWRVQWAPSLIFKDLTADTFLRRSDYPAPRGNIFDRTGKPLAVDGTVAQLGIVPAEIRNEQQMLDKVSETLGLSKRFIRDQYRGKEPSFVWIVRDIPRDRVEEVQSRLGDVPGVTFRERPGRVYPQGTLMAQVLGYVTGVFAEDLEKPEYATYTETDMIGRSGLEAWGERYLRGESGGRLYIVDANEAPVAVIKEKPFRPGNNIYLNIDVTLQSQAEQNLGGRPGAIVAMDPRNGEILALVSQPSYDPNDFVVGISQEKYDQLTSEKANNPFQNRAGGSSYPMASTFKVITTSAALTLKLPNLNRTWYSDGTWERLGPQDVRRDWKEGGHGYVRLLDGITESIDTIYYDLGYELYEKCYDCLSEHARQWKLGSQLGVAGIPEQVEAAGQVPGPGVPTPGWGPGDNVNLAIGQGALTVSPLQVAFVYSTIGNGGTMYRPNLVNRIVAADDNTKIIRRWEPTVLGRAPASPETIRFLQQGLRTVVNAENGTANSIFKDSPISSAGKTGTGQQDKKYPYAWYAGYAPAVSPKVTVVALAENAGEGSEIAAPIVEKVFEQYLKPPATRP